MFGAILFVFSILCVHVQNVRGVCSTTFSSQTLGTCTTACDATAKSVPAGFLQGVDGDGVSFRVSPSVGIQAEISPATSIVTFDKQTFTLACAACFCDASDVCPTSVQTDSNCVGGYTIRTDDGNRCVTFVTTGQLPSSATHQTLTSEEIDIDGGARTYSGTFSTNSNGHLLTLDVTSSDQAEKIFFAACGPFITVTALKKRQLPVSSEANSAGPGTFAPLNGNANADPHLVGANGVKFDFRGRDNGVYNLFVSPQFQINMQLAADGPKKHFMTHVAVMFRNETVTFAASKQLGAPSFVDNVNEQLNKHGAKATAVKKDVIRLDLCGGHQTVTVTRTFTTRKDLVHADHSPFVYLNVAVRTAHCDDKFGGALGQTYRCKFVKDHAPFKFDQSTEESFRVATIGTQVTPFDPAAPCVAQHQGEAGLVGNSA